MTNELTNTELETVTGGDASNDPNLKDVIHEAGKECAIKGTAGAIIGGTLTAPTGPGALAGIGTGASLGCAEGVVETGVRAVWDWVT